MTPISKQPPRELDPHRWLEDHGDSLFAFALQRTRDRQLAEELVQETLLAGLRSRSSFSGTSSVRTWLVGILKHKLADHYRRHARQIATEVPGELLESLFTKRGKWKASPLRWSRDPAAEAEQAELAAVLKRCLNKLPPRFANAFLLFEQQGLSTENVSKALGTSTTNTGVILYRARSALRHCLERHWFRPRAKGRS